MVEFFELPDSHSQDFTGAMKVYDAAFPQAEKQPETLIRQRLDDGSFLIFVGKDHGLVAFVAIFWRFPKDDFVLLSYMAADETHRGAGIASHFMKWICADHDLGRAPVLLEVEDPAFGDDRKTRERRIAFYQRIGARTLTGVSYILPPLSGGEPTEMLLMAIHPQPTEFLSGDCVRRLVTSLYVDLYGRPASDPSLAKVLASIAERVPLK